MWTFWARTWAWQRMILHLPWRTEVYGKPSQESDRGRPSEWVSDLGSSKVLQHLTLVHGKTYVSSLGSREPNQINGSTKELHAKFAFYPPCSFSISALGWNKIPWYQTVVLYGSCYLQAVLTAYEVKDWKMLYLKGINLTLNLSCI